MSRTVTITDSTGRYEHEPFPLGSPVETTTPTTILNGNEHKVITFEKGVKLDSGKSRMDLIPAEALPELGTVMGFGANKYGDHNWRKGIAYSRLIAAAYRHLNAFHQGEDKDQESTLHHLSHATANLMMLYTMQIIQAAQDDRWKAKK